MTEGNGEGQSNREVLVVEDDPEINELVGAYVQIAGFRYHAALNGAEALERVRHCRPSLIVLDLMLPDLSGWEICRRVKNTSKTHDVPVIILSALDNEASRRQGVSCGVSDYLTKPFDPDQLLRALTEHASGGIREKTTP